jgi:hypothetical protein
VQRYKEFMEIVTDLVTQRYDGSLKASMARDEYGALCAKGVG